MTIDWCLKHDREVKNRFVAAVCPNEPGCQVVPKDSHMMQSVYPYAGPGVVAMEDIDE